jgi:hypothetical protein
LIAVVLVGWISEIEPGAREETSAGFFLGLMMDVRERAV